jgi:hypothetical protein
MVSNRGLLLRPEGGAGWIVLGSVLPEIGGSSRRLGEQLLSRIDLARRPICVTSSEADRSKVEGFVEELEAWLGSEVIRLEPEELAVLEWREAGLVVLVGGPPAAWVSALSGAHSRPDGPHGADEATLVYAVGDAAEALGAWIVPPGGEPQRGVGWLRGGVVLAGKPEPSAVRGVPELLAREDHSYALGLGDRAILALGPAGEVEVWGEARPTITLGRGWR